jgi:hypothetical protein
MLLPERDELEKELLKKRIETYKFINGFLALGYVGLAVYAVYLLVGLFL